MSDLLVLFLLVLLIGAALAISFTLLAVAIVLAFLYAASRVGYWIAGPRGAYVFSLVALIAFIVGLYYGLTS